MPQTSVVVQCAAPVTAYQLLAVSRKPDKPMQLPHYSPRTHRSLSHWMWYPLLLAAPTLAHAQDAAETEADAEAEPRRVIHEAVGSLERERSERACQHEDQERRR